MANPNTYKSGIFIEPFTVEAGGLAVRATIERPLDEEGLPVVLVPGWSEGQTALTDLRHALAQLGRPAITLEPPRDFKGHLLDAGNQRVYNIQAILQYLKSQYDYESFDFLAHSMGGIDTVSAAQVDGDKMNHVVLAGSAGLIEGDTPLEILARLGGSILKEETQHILDNPINEVKVASRGVWNVVSNLIRSASEGIHASTTDIRAQITELGQQGLPITRMQFLNDSVFPVDRVEQSMAAHNHHSRHHFAIPHAGHNATSHFPREVAQTFVALSEDKTLVS